MNSKILNLVGFKESLCPVAVRAVFGCVNYDLRWIGGVKIAQGLIFSIIEADLNKKGHTTLQISVPVK